MKIVLDAFGGDYAPYEIVKGAVLGLKEFKDIGIVLTGDEVKIKDVLAQLEKEDDYKNVDLSRLEIINASEVITNFDKPTEAIRTKKDSSLVKGLDYLKTNDEAIAIISAGSTGAVLTGGFMKIGRLKGVSRPALCPVIPTKTGNPVVLIDCGANMDCKPINLLHFALIGSNYYKAMFGKENPKVALLSVGTEDEKGNELVKKTYPYMQNLPINFVGNMEARDFLSGDYDVVVSDGFAGNTLLKASEGAILTIVDLLKQTIKSGSIKSKIGGLLIKKPLKQMLKSFDYSNHGGSAFLGLKKIVIKAHGNSKARSIKICIEQAIKLHNSNCFDAIQSALESAEIKIDEEA